MDILQFDVLVQDRGSNPNQNSSTVTINIADVNDEVPQFTESVYTVPVRENSPAQEILRLSYTDGDTLSEHTNSEVTLINPPGI